MINYPKKTPIFTGVIFHKELQVSYLEKEFVKNLSSINASICQIEDGKYYEWFEP